MLCMCVLHIHVDTGMQAHVYTQRQEDIPWSHIKTKNKLLEMTQPHRLLWQRTWVRSQHPLAA